MTKTSRDMTTHCFFEEFAKHAVPRKIKFPQPGQDEYTYDLFVGSKDSLSTFNSIKQLNDFVGERKGTIFYKRNPHQLNFSDEIIVDFEKCNTKQALEIFCHINNFGPDETDIVQNNFVRFWWD